MQAEFSHLFKEENYIKNTGLVHSFNSREARLARIKRDKSAKIMSLLAQDAHNTAGLLTSL